MTIPRFSPATLDALARWSITRGALLDASASGDDHAYLTARHDEQNAYEACCDALDADRERARLADDEASRAEALPNMCDGCQRGLPLVDGLHRGASPFDLLCCTAGRYGHTPSGIADEEARRASPHRFNDVPRTTEAL